MDNYKWRDLKERINELTDEQLERDILVVDMMNQKEFAVELIETSEDSAIDVLIVNV